MKKLFVVCLFVLALLATSAFAEQMTGVFTCSKCKHTDESAATCAKTCVKNGVPPVFISSDNKTFKIANPKKIGDVYGKKVTVEGKVTGETLKIDKITPAA